MKIVITFILALFLIFLIAQVWLFSDRARIVENDYADVSRALSAERAEEKSLRSDYTYFLNPLNLEKELRARFNFRGSEEKMIIIVPKTSSSKP